ncbi:MAG: nucleotidyltransferase domain-containing protein [Ignavibacteria bacterium]|nr:nucleotidyltransferase domain-containing protein [Ignavibacteria bacterium]
MKTLLKCIVGSHAYSTNTPESDVDYKGIYQQSNRELLGFAYKEQYEVSKDECYFEIKRFLELIQTANPTILEIIFSPEDCILYKNLILNNIFNNRSKFLTKKCKMSFGGYALQQIKKARGLNKKQNWEQTGLDKQKNPIEFCNVVLDSINKIAEIKQGVYPLLDWLNKNNLKQEEVYVNKLNHSKEGYQLYLSKAHSGGGITAENSTSLRTVSSPLEATPIATILYNADTYRQHCADFVSYKRWLDERNQARYTDYEKHGQQIDGKNMLHCRRLLDTAMEIASQGTINVRRPNAEYLLAIRRGEVKLEDILKQAEEDVILLDELFAKSNLPDEVDKDLIESLLLEIRGI